MGISGIGSATSNYYTQLSSGKRINSAADDASGLAIAEKMKTQENGFDVGANNASDSQSMVNVADGALNSITDSLQRMYELSVKASNTFMYGADELKSIQGEIDQLKEQISNVSSTTTFNEMKLLDGSMPSSHVASNPDGSGIDLQMPNSTLEALGLADYDITGDFDISVLTDALKTVSGERATLGAQYNSLDHAINYNQYSSYNMTESRSRIEDLDFAKGISDLKKNELLEQYRMNMIKKKEEDDGKVLKLFNIS